MIQSEFLEEHLSSEGVMGYGGYENNKAYEILR